MLIINASGILKKGSVKIRFYREHIDKIIETDIPIPKEDDKKYSRRGFYGNREKWI